MADVGTTDPAQSTRAERRALPQGARILGAKSAVTIVSAAVVLFLLCWIFAPSSVSSGVLLSMLPFAAVLAIVGLGQMLVVQQGGIDLSVPGAVSLAIVVVSHYPNGVDNRLLPAVLLAIVFAIAAGLLNGLLVGLLKLNSIVATLGTNALLYGVVLGISNGIPRSTTRLLSSIATGRPLWVPNAVWFALGTLIIVAVLVKKTVAGRRFEAIGANPVAARAVGLRVKLHHGAAFVWAQLLYCLAGVLLAGITTQPTAFQGDAYLLPSVAVVVLGGTSLLGGRGFPISTVVAALFLTQLDQFVLALGVPFAVQTLVQAAALAGGVALYTVNWRAVRGWFTSRRPTPAVAAATG
jgi:ribose transport system permease protein